MLGIGSCTTGTFEERFSLPSVAYTNDLKRCCFDRVNGGFTWRLFTLTVKPLHATANTYPSGKKVWAGTTMKLLDRKVIPT